MPDDGNFSLKTIAGEINWGEALELIVHEGFYMFGGLHENGRVTDKLLIFLPGVQKISGRAQFKLIEPETMGKSPPARYMHSINYMPKLSLVIIHGGRDDTKIR